MYLLFIWGGTKWFWLFYVPAYAYAYAYVCIMQYAF
jgi:hypothetical protein